MFWPKKVVLSLKNMTKLMPFDSVLYKGHTYLLVDIQPRINKNGLVDDFAKIVGKKFKSQGKWVSLDECKKVRTLGNYINSFKNAYKFYSL